MWGMRPQGTAQQLEARRRQAIERLKAGQKLSAVARAVGSSVSSVHRWHETYRKKGMQGLRPRPTPGRPAKLSSSQKERLLKILLKGSLAAGYRTDLWTLERVAEVIAQNFGVQYHPCHVWRLLRGLAWSCQKPERRALQRDEKGIAHWKRYPWPHIKRRRPKGRLSGLSR